MSATETLRAKVEACGLSRYAVAKATGIPESTLSRFVASGKGLSSVNLDKLCDFLGLVLVTKAGKARKGK